MAINPQNVLSQLRMMSDQQLQQYAAMHKNDPFVFPLAFQESQTRKQMRDGAQMRQQPQAKVADQALAAMVPEDVGIGALPADNMKGMCGGGIVAFDEGGEVPRYNGTAGSWIDQLPQDAWLRKLAQNYRQGRPLLDIQPPQAQPAASAAFVPSSPKAFTPSVEGLPGAAGPMMPPVAALGAQGAPVPRTPAAELARQAAGEPQLRLGGGQGLTPSPGLTQSAAGTIAELQAMREQLGNPTVPQATQDAIARYQQAGQKAGEEGLAALKADIAAQGPGMEGAEKRAQAREERIAKREGDLVGMSILEAGLAMMSGESPHALVNIGRGGQAGMKSYAAGLDKLQEARDKLDESFDKIEQFRMQRADMNAKDIRAAKADIRRTQVEAEKLGLDALMKNGEMDRADARSAFDVMTRNRATMYEVGSRERLGLAQIAAQKEVAGATGQLGLFKALGGGDAAKGLGVYAGAMGPEARSETAMLQQYMKNPLLFKVQNPQLAAQFEALLAQQAMPGVMSTPTGQVRD